MLLGDRGTCVWAACPRLLPGRRPTEIRTRDLLGRKGTLYYYATLATVAPLNGRQEALLLQRDCATRLSVEILQLRIIPFEKDCNRQMTLKYIHPMSSQLLLLDKPYITSCWWPVVAMSLTSTTFRFYHFWSERDCLWPWELLHFWQWSLSHKPGALCNLCVNIRSRITLYLWVISITKVSNSKSDLQTHSRTLAVMPFDRPCMISYLSFIVTMYLSCTVSKILSVISQNLITSRDSENLKSLPLPTTKIWKTTNNAEIGVVWWFGVTQGHRQHSNWIQHIWLPNWL